MSNETILKAQEHAIACGNLALELHSALAMLANACDEAGWPKTAEQMAPMNMARAALKKRLSSPPSETGATSEKADFDFYCAAGDCSDQCDPCREDCPGPQEARSAIEQGTPRTDAVRRSDRGGWPQQYDAMTDLARQLERELATCSRQHAEAESLLASSSIERCEGSKAYQVADMQGAPLYVPVCGNHAESWFTGRDHLARGMKAECIVCAHTALSATGSWQPMLTAPLDGTEIEIMVRHFDYFTAKKISGEECANGQYQGAVIGHWIDHNGGGWTWHGHAGVAVGWRPLDRKSV